MKDFLITICLVVAISLIYFTANFSNTSKLFSYSVFGEYENNTDDTNISHILFGIAGSAETWKNRSRYSELWWKPNVTRGFVWLDRTPPPQLPPLGNAPWPETFPPYRVSQDTSAFKYTCSHGNRSAVRIARVVKESFELGFKNVRWFVMGDDDTVFFTENLVTVLAKYDHNQMYYIGGNSESVEQDVTCSYSMAYGGGGFAISYRLAAELVKILDGCINRYHYLYASDQKVGGCMDEIGIPLTKELGFHQMDITGSPRGFLAAHPLAPLVSLHHLDMVNPLIPLTSQVESVKKVVGAYKKDASRTLQQSLCYDLIRNWSVSVSWGYSVQLYPWLMNVRELVTPIRTFQTFNGFEEPFTFSTRPDYVEPCKRPIEYCLDQVTDIRNGETLTGYNRVGNINKQCMNERYRPALAIATVNVKAPILSPQVWRQVPRRQCCKVINGEDGIGSVLHIRIRGCYQWESITPPFYDKYGEFADFQRMV